MSTYPPHPTLGTPEHIAALAEIDRETEAFRERNCIGRIPAEQTRRLKALSAAMIAAGWPFPVEETAERLAKARKAVA